MSIISFKQVHYTYPGDELESLCGVDLEIEQGEFVAVLGHNGSGKSTLAKHMNAILVPDEGKVVVDGIDSSEEDDVYQIRRRVGMVFQNPDNQIVANVVEDDVAFAPENLGVPSAEIRERVDAALKQVGMYEYRTHAPHLLSGGQKQRVAIAGVIAMQPKIIVLDEPTAMLDPQGAPYGRVRRRGQAGHHVQRLYQGRRHARGDFLGRGDDGARGPRRAGDDQAAVRAQRPRLLAAAGRAG